MNTNPAVYPLSFNPTSTPNFLHKRTIPAPEITATSVKPTAKYLPMPKLALNTIPVASLFLLVEVAEPDPVPLGIVAPPEVAAAMILEQLLAAPAALTT